LIRAASIRSRETGSSSDENKRGRAGPVVNAAQMRSGGERRAAAAGGLGIRVLRIVNPTPRRVDRSTVARLEVPGPKGIGDGQVSQRGHGCAAMGVFGEGQRAGIALGASRLAPAGRRVRRAPTVVVTRRGAGRTRTRVPAGRGGRRHPFGHRAGPKAAGRGRARSLPPLAGIQSGKIEGPRPKT